MATFPYVQEVDGILFYQCKRIAYVQAQTHNLCTDNLTTNPAELKEVNNNILARPKQMLIIWK